MTMLAAMFYAPLDVRLEQRPIPQPAAGEVLLKVAAATTCGTDVKTYLRGHPILFSHIPAGFGHEVAGIVAATGIGVTQCAEGDVIWSQIRHHASNATTAGEVDLAFVKIYSY